MPIDPQLMVPQVCILSRNCVDSFGWLIHSVVHTLTNREKPLHAVVSAVRSIAVIDVGQLPTGENYMGTQSSAQKVCKNCGKNVSQTKRVKDDSGRYFCPPCWHELGRSALAQAPDGDLDHDNSVPDLSGISDGSAEPSYLLPGTFGNHLGATKPQPVRDDANRRLTIRLSIGAVLCILLLFCGIFGWNAWQNRWDNSHRDEILALKSQAETFREQGDVRRAYQTYQKLIQIVGNNQARNPMLASAIADARSVFDQMGAEYQALLEREAADRRLVEEKRRLANERERLAQTEIARQSKEEEATAIRSFLTAIDNYLSRCRDFRKVGDDHAQFWRKHPERSLANLKEYISSQTRVSDAALEMSRLASTVHNAYAKVPEKFKDVRFRVGLIDAAAKDIDTYYAQFSKAEREMIRVRLETARGNGPEDADSVLKRSSQLYAELYARASISCEIASLLMGKINELGPVGVTVNDRPNIERTESITSASAYAMAMRFASSVSKEHNDAKAVEWFQKAVALGNTDAMFELGVRYASGVGVAADAGKSAELFKRAAELGHVGSMRNLGVLYHKQDKFAEAANWYRKAADGGDGSAAYSLGSLYFEGQGVTKDFRQAMDWFRKAADLCRKAADAGDASAMNLLAGMYAAGIGVPRRDDAEALAWYQKAAKAGNKNAQETLAETNRNR
jgi:TPR repeat protein